MDDDYLLRAFEIDVSAAMREQSTTAGMPRSPTMWDAGCGSAAPRRNVGERADCQSTAGSQPAPHGFFIRIGEPQAHADSLAMTLRARRRRPRYSSEAT